MLQRLEGFPTDTLGFVAHGRVTADDYRTSIEPAVAAAGGGVNKLNVYFELAPDFQTFAPGAMLEDLKMGFGNLSRWNRVAVVADEGWLAKATRAFAFLSPAVIRVFPRSESEAARAWVSARG